MLVHGLGSAAINWLEVIPGLAARRPVLAMDLPGFGRTEPPRVEAARMGATARFLHALLDPLGWDEVEVHGNSMGGHISVLFAARAGDRVTRLVLVSPALTTRRRDTTQLERLTFAQFSPFLVPGLGGMLLKRMHMRMSPQQLYDQTAGYLHADPERVAPELGAVSLENIEFGRDTPWRLPAFALAAMSVVREVLTRRRIERAVADVTAPVRVVWGDRDRIIGRPVIDRVVALRPDRTIEVLDGVGHVAMIESPQRYLDVVAAWRPAAEHRRGSEVWLHRRRDRTLTPRFAGSRGPCSGWWWGVVGEACSHRSSARPVSSRFSPVPPVTTNRVRPR